MSEIDPVLALITCGEALWTTVLVGNPAPIVRDIYDWMKVEPSDGDLVLEMSTRGAKPERIGTFVRYEHRQVCVHELRDIAIEVCSECNNEDRFDERFVWIRRVAADGPELHRWYNCNFIRIPSREQLRAIKDGPATPTPDAESGGG